MLITCYTGAAYNFRCLIRRLKSDVLSQLPSKQRQMVILDPTAVKTKSKEMEAKSSSYGKASNSSMDKKALLLEWFNLTGQAKAKAVTEYLKDVLEAHQKFLCFAHHKVRLRPRISARSIICSL